MDTDFPYNISTLDHTFNSGHSVMEHLNPEWKIIFSTLFGCIGVLAIVTNAIIIKTIHCYNELHTQSNKLLASLAITDLLTGLIVAPVNILQLLNTNKELVTKIYTIRIFVSTMLVLTSDNITAFISFDRCLHITKLMRYDIRNKTFYQALAFCWLIPLATCIVLPLQLHKAFLYLVNGQVWTIFVLLIMFYVTLLYYLQKYIRGDEIIETDIYIKDQKSATLTVIVIVTLYIAMRVPALVSFCFVMSNKHSLAFRTQFYSVANFICISNSFVNPLVYGCRTLRCQIRKLLYD